MKVYGLIGYPLAHSFSKKYFTEKFEKEEIADCSYELFPLQDVSEFPWLLEVNKDLAGLNVTIPYKQAIIPYLDELDKTALDIDAVNTIAFENGILKGYNSDVDGFERSLMEFLPAEDYPTFALILGTGGASKAVAYVLEKHLIDYQFVTSDPEKIYLRYQELTHSIIDESKLIINTTPLGMYPDVDSGPNIPYESITKNHFLFDLVYNPAVTMFLRNGKMKGAKIQNGLPMLSYQADKAWEIWNRSIKDEV